MVFVGEVVWRWCELTEEMWREEASCRIETRVRTKVSARSAGCTKFMRSVRETASVRLVTQFAPLENKV
jgi:hypothetical protein